MRGHVLHPLLIWRDAAEELEQPDFWAQHDVAKVVGECAMLDVRSASLGLREQLFSQSSLLAPGGRDIRQPLSTEVVTPLPIVQVLSSSAESNASSVLAPLQAAHVASLPMQISLKGMISTSIALKSGLDIEVVDKPSEAGWATTLVEQQSQARPRSPSQKSIASLSNRSHTPDAPHAVQNEDGVPSHIAFAIAGLQREILMLRSELNFELWMARENVKHIGRLYQDRVVSRTAEVERQGLVRVYIMLMNASHPMPQHNRLREYKAEVFRLQKEVKEQKEQALKVKNQYADWNKKLQDKIKEFRNEKNSWQTEAAAMRSAHKETQVSSRQRGVPTEHLVE